MSEQKSWTRKVAPPLVKAALVALKAAGGSMILKDLLAEVERKVSLDDEDKALLKSGIPRWQPALRWAALELDRSGFIRRTQGRWILTPEGEALIPLSADEIFDRARAGFKKWQAAQPPKAGSDADGATAVIDVEQEDDSPESGVMALEEAEGAAIEEIKAAVTALNPYAFQDLVAALLRGMGYFTVWIAPPGPDGGIDVVAYQDPLGTKTPHIKVQVKHRNQKASRAEVAELKGVLHHNRETGLFVSSGGFTPDAEREADASGVHIELIDLDRFLKLWIENYEKLSEDDKGLLRLKKVYFLAPE